MQPTYDREASVQSPSCVGKSPGSFFCIVLGQVRLDILLGHMIYLTLMHLPFRYWSRPNSPFSSAILCSMCLVFVVQSSPGQPAGAVRTLPGHVPLAAVQLTPVGSLPASQRLNLAITLPLRDPAKLHDLLRQLYDPSSVNYRKYLTPGEFTERFGASESDYAAVMAFARNRSLTITKSHPNRLVLDVNASVAEIEQAFQVKLKVYNHPSEARKFFAPDTEPQVTAGLAIQHISGLDSYWLPHPNSKPMPLDQTAGAAQPRNGSGPSGSYRGSDFRNAYLPGTTLTGSGQSVGLLEFDGYFANDISTYENQSGLTGNVPQLVPVAVNGGVLNPGNGNGEVSLDIEMVVAMAPGLSKIYVYEAPNPSPWVDLLSAMANDNLAKQLSCSWGGGGPNLSAEAIFQQMAAQGQCFFNATGDADAYTGSIPFPSDSTNIVQVGGTTLTTGSGASYSSETVWNWGHGSGSGGGISTFYSIPSWQQTVSMANNQGSTTMRNLPDVALTADNVYQTYNNGSAGAVGGTSCAAPLWAAFTALANQRAASAGKPPVGFLNPALYTIGQGPNYNACFRDITTGNNTWTRSRSQFYAVTGYDLCTGWGTPNGTNLINALVPLQAQPNPPAISSQPTNLVLLVGSAATFNVQASGASPLSYQWRFGGSNISAANGSSYTRSNVQLTDSGLYSVVVANTSGSITSSNAQLSVVSHPLLSAPRVSSNGNFGFTLNGDAGFNFAVESTTNLSNWSLVAILTNPAGQVLFTDTNSHSGRFRAYRARLAP